MLGFLRSIDFRIPSSVPVRISTTADIVRDGKTTASAKQQQTFDSLRKQYTVDRNNWLQALQKFEHIERFGNARMDILDNAEGEYKQYAAVYKQRLADMAERSNGIWNCQEFADFALMTIKGTLPRGYIASIGYLNDVQIPEQDLLKSRNHDHAFVVIQSGDGREQYVVDLWQQFVVHNSFIGTSSEFIRSLNPDGRYVLAGVTERDICTIPIDDLIKIGGTPYRDPISGEFSSQASVSTASAVVADSVTMVADRSKTASGATSARVRASSAARSTPSHLLSTSSPLLAKQEKAKGHAKDGARRSIDLIKDDRTREQNNSSARPPCC
jgi:hypothetical protein